MKHTKLLLLALCLLLAACGSKPAASSGGSSAPAPEVSVPAPAVSQPEPDVSEPDASLPETPAPLTDEDKAAAHQAALDYYQNTVFEVDTLTEIEPRQGEVAFRVACSKGGAKVDPDRTITLERQNGVWTVINEGY